MTGGSGLQIDPLIGRDDDLQAIAAALKTARLVTLTGPGGTGKTRLADSAVLSMRAAGREAWFVDCSEIEDSSLVAGTIVAALNVKDHSGREPSVVLTDALRERDLLVALDNLEQLDGAGRVATELLKAIPGLRVLATSRISLGVRGELELPVAPLELPNEDSPAALLASPAGRLFLTRAGARLPAAAIDPVTAREVATLIRRLDGLPLAIELAAARTRAMTPGEINRRLDAQGPEAIDDARDDRHRSLGLVIDWTIGQLAPADTFVLEAVAVCAGFDLALVEALDPGRDVLPAIESLVALGLVQRAGVIDGTSRFRMLQTIQALVLRRIAPELRSALERRHAAHFLDVAAEWEQGIRRGATGDLSAAFEADAENMRRALDRFESEDPATGLVLMARLEPFWSSHSRQGEGYERFQRAVTRSTSPTAELVRAAESQFIAISMTLAPTARITLNDWIIEHARALEEWGVLASALRHRSIIAEGARDFATASAVVAEAVAELRQIAISNSPIGRVMLLEAEAWQAALLEGRTSDRHVRLMRQLVSALEAIGEVSRYAAYYMNLAVALFGRGEYDEGLRLSRAGATNFKEVDWLPNYAITLGLSAACLAELDRVPDAVTTLLECAAASLDAGSGEHRAWTIWSAIPVALAAGQPELAARLWGCLVNGMQPRGETALTPLDMDLLDGWQRRARARAPEIAIELALRDGERADPAALLQSLPELLARPTDRRGGASDRLRHGDLTKREVEILTLVGRGRTDPEIAAELFISPKTASVHVANIKAKLGVGSRLQIALRARELGLVDQTA